MPDDFTVDFFCIGAGKCGSTWLAQCVGEHPQITVAANKEPNFFVRKLGAFDGGINPDFMAGWNGYKSQYKAAAPGDKLGDFSVNLMHNVAEAPTLLHRHFPDAKLLVLLRDPVARTYSHYWHDRQYEDIPEVPRSFAAALEHDELLFRSEYHRQLDIWLRTFDAGRFFFVIDTDLRRDAGSVLRSLFAFLEVDPDFRPPSLNTRINSATARKKWFNTLLRAAAAGQKHGLAPLIDFARYFGLHRLALRYGDRLAPYPPLEPDIARRLRERFRPDVERLERMIGRDLQAWKP